MVSCSRITKTAGCIFIFLLFITCNTQQVITFTGPDPQFEDYYTYKVLHNELPPDDSEGFTEARLFIQKVESTIDVHMKSRGYSPSEIPDITVEYKLILSNKVDYRRDDSFRYTDPYYEYNRRYNPYLYYTKREYTEGTLIVDLREGYGKKLVWEASMDLKYNRSRSGKSEDPLVRAFNSIFEAYPYRAGSSEMIKVEEENNNR